MLKTQKGVTLVALVITIIVLLILAGVTISLVLNGGILDQATNAVSESVYGDVRERVTMAAAEARMAELSPGNDDTFADLFVAGLQTSGAIDDATSTPKMETTTTTATFKIGGKYYSAIWNLETNNSIKEGKIEVTQITVTIP